MGGRVGQWLQSLGAGILRVGRSVSDAFASLFSGVRDITGQAPDAEQLRSVLENEQLLQITWDAPDWKEVSAWVKSREGDAPALADSKISHDLIRQSDYALAQPYQVRAHFTKYDKDGVLLKEKWVTLWEHRNKSPREIADDAANYWATAGEKYGYDLSFEEFEVWEDPFHSDWAP